jgi:hypothetical protein
MRACPRGGGLNAGRLYAATGPGYPLVLLAHALAGRGLRGTASIPHAWVGSVHRAGQNYVRKLRCKQQSVAYALFVLVLLAHALAGRGLWGTASIPHAWVGSVHRAGQNYVRKLRCKQQSVAYNEVCACTPRPRLSRTWAVGYRFYPSRVGRHCLTSMHH